MLRRRFPGRLRAVLLAGLLCALLAPAARAAQSPVYFLQGEQAVGVQRDGATIESSVAALLTGPTKAERKKGMRTYIPPATRLDGVELDEETGIATVDLSGDFADEAPTETLGARVAQLVFTVTAVPGVKRVQVLLEGATPVGLFPGFNLTAPVSAADIRRPRTDPPPPAEPVLPVPSQETIDLQARLAALGYLDPSGVDGIGGPGTRSAVIAFQKWQGLDRDGIVGPATRGALAKARRPTPRVKDGRRHVAVLLDRQVALLVLDGAVFRTLHVSTGAPGYATPPGSYAIFRKEERSWSVPFSVWLPWASYFVGGIAFHEYPDIPVTAASHGCVRVPAGDAELLYEFAPIGTPVYVLAES